MKVTVDKKCRNFDSYRSSRVRSTFNVEKGSEFHVDAEIPVEDMFWSIGVIVGASGSGKSSIGEKIWEDIGIYDISKNWDSEKPIVDQIAIGKPFEEVSNALTSVGLGSVPSWLRPFNVLSNGEKFRAGLARIIADAPDRVVIDEFTSVVDRQVARVGSHAFAKAWRKTSGRAVILSCHYDIIDWLEPDWVYDMEQQRLQRGCLWRRPEINIDIYKSNGSCWGLFEKHHYLKLKNPVASTWFVGASNGKPVCCVCASPRLDIGGVRLSRLVVHPDYQGVGIGVRFLNGVTKLLSNTDTFKFADRVKNFYINTSHTGLFKSLVKGGWKLHSNSMDTFDSSRNRKNRSQKIVGNFGGHFRAIRGYRISKEEVLMQ